MRFRAKRELLLQISTRYHGASYHQKSLILNEFIATTADHFQRPARAAQTPRSLATTKPGALLKR
jgi:hypothetical protein